MIHEFAHKKRLEHEGGWKCFQFNISENCRGVPAFKEASLCLETQMFGNVLGAKIDKITEETAKEVLEKNLWENSKSLGEIPGKLVTEQQKIEICCLST